MEIREQVPEENKRLLEAHQKNIAFFLAHYDELLKHYPEQSIAILAQQVVASDPDPWHLLDILEERGLPVERILIRHLQKQPYIVIV